jgi:hypothetical protein
MKFATLADLKAARHALLGRVTAQFNSKNRAMDHNGLCVYDHRFNGGCAIGRELSDELAGRLIGAVSATIVFNQLPDELKALGKDFLAVVQKLHDYTKYWNESGLSEEGKERVKEIERKIEEDLFS